MKAGSIICLALFTSAALLSLVQMWFQPLDFGIFLMTIVTLAVLFVVALGITLVRKEYISGQKLKDAGYLD